MVVEYGVAVSVRDVVEQGEINLVKSLEVAVRLHEDVQQVTGHVDALHSSISGEIRPALADSTEHLYSLMRELSDSQLQLQIVSQLLELSQLFNHTQGKLQLDGQLLTPACVELSQLQLAVNDLYARTHEKVDLVSAMRERFDLLKEQLVHQLCDRWNRLVSWKTVDDDDDVVVLMIINDVPSNRELQEDLLSVLQDSGQLEDYVRKFSHVVFTRFLEPILDGKCSLNINHVPDQVRISLSRCISENIDRFSVVSNQIVDLLKCLKTSLFVDRDVCMVLTSENVGSRLSSSVANTTLPMFVHAAPADCQRMCHLVADVGSYHQQLLDLSFPGGAGDVLLGAASSADKLLLDSFCTERLKMARNIVLRSGKANKELVSVGSAAEAKDQGPREQLLVGDAGVLKCGIMETSLLVLPQCLVSKSAVDIADLVESTLLIVQSEGLFQHCARSEACVSLIVELYLSSLLSAHDSLNRQQLIVAYTSVEYVAHRISLLQRASLLGTVPRLHSCACQLLQAAVDAVRDDLSAELRRFEGDLEKLDVRLTSACVGIVDRVLQEWQSVLPEYVMARVASLLWSHIVNHMLQHVLAESDISATCSAQILEATDRVAGRVERAVEGPVWRRFRDLRDILAFSLCEIELAWTEGDVQESFSAEEVKHLIRALFQNTERRARVLGLIK